MSEPIPTISQYRRGQRQWHELLKTAAEPSPLPWECQLWGGNVRIFDSRQRLTLARMHGKRPKDLANARLIVRAVNNHENLTILADLVVAEFKDDDSEFANLARAIQAKVGAS